MKKIKAKDAIKKYGSKVIDDATASGDLKAYITCPETGRTIRVHRDLVKKMRAGESITLQEILNCNLN